MKTLVIVPAYNEELNLPSLIKELKDFNYDFLIINDCSNDHTTELLNKNNWNHLDLSFNVGLAAVTRVGFMYAKDHNYDTAVVIDGDGQHNPEYISVLLSEIEKGNDYVVGSRFVSVKKKKSLRMFGSNILCFFIRIKTGTKVTDPTSGMRALSRNVINDFSSGMNFIAEPDALAYALHHRYKVKEVQVNMREREEGESYFKSPLRTIKFMFETIVSILFIQW